MAKGWAKLSEDIVKVVKGKVGVISRKHLDFFQEPDYPRQFGIELFRPDYTGTCTFVLWKNGIMVEGQQSIYLVKIEDGRLDPQMHFLGVTYEIKHDRLYVNLPEAHTGTVWITMDPVPRRKLVVRQ